MSGYYHTFDDDGSTFWHVLSQVRARTPHAPLPMMSLCSRGNPTWAWACERCWTAPTVRTLAGDPAPICRGGLRAIFAGPAQEAESEADAEAALAWKIRRASTTSASTLSGASSGTSASMQTAA